MESELMECIFVIDCYLNACHYETIDFLGIKYFLKAYGCLPEGEELNYFLHC